MTETESRPIRSSARRHEPATRRAALVVPACYLAAALILTWRLWADPASKMVAGNQTDADLFAWYLRYAATAVRHASLPALVTSAMNAPVGVNMMWNTSLLLPGVLLAPVTLLLGPQVSLTILVTAGFAGSAAALYYVLRRWQVSIGPAALAGAVYGFSPALLHSAVGHYNLQLAILPPLIIDAGLRLAVGPPSVPDHPAASRASLLPGPVRDGIRLGLLLAAQLFISEELALITAITGLLLVAGLAAARPRSAVRRVLPATAGLLLAAGVTLALASPALWTQFRGPLVQHGPLFPLDYYVNDPVGFVTPSSYLLFHTAGTATAAARYQGGATEYLAYLGWPLVVVLALAAVACWRRPAGRAVALTLAVLVVFSLGGHPLIGGTVNPAVDLPWHWVEEHQLFASVLPDRISILADAAAAVLVALGIDAVGQSLAARHRLTAQPGPAGDRAHAVLATTSMPADSAPPGAEPTGAEPTGAESADAESADAESGDAESGDAESADAEPAVRALGTPRLPAPRAPAVVLVAAVLACLPLLPRPLPVATATPLPGGWTRTFTALRLPAGARVLVIPVPTNILTAAMRWQADTGQPSAIVGGYFIGPGAGGQAYLGGTGVRPTAWYLDQLWAAGLPPRSPFATAALAAGLPVAGPSGPASVTKSPTSAQVNADLEFWRPAAVVAVTAASSPLAYYLVRLLGPPTVRSGTVLAWRR